MTLYSTFNPSLITLTCHNSGTLSWISTQSIPWTEFSWIPQTSHTFGEKHLHASFWNQPQSQTLRFTYVKLCSLSYHDPLRLHEITKLQEMVVLLHQIFVSLMHQGNESIPQERGGERLFLIKICLRPSK